MNLTKQGLLLIAIFSFFQLCIFLAIIALEDRAERLDMNDYHAVHVIGRSNWLAVELLQMSLSSAMARLTGDQTYLSNFENSKQALPKEFDSLELLYPTQSSSRVQVRTARELATKMVEILQSEDLEKTDLSKESIKARVDSKLLPIWKQLKSIRQSLLAAERFQFTGLERMPQSILALHTLIVIAIFLLIIFSIVTFVFFVRTITKRLETLTVNSKRFAKHEELLPPVSGEDEVAKLDQAFHEMAAAVKFAEQKKAEYVQMINHDLRTPLGSVIASMQLLYHPNYALSEKGLSLVTLANRNLDRVLHMINEMLEIDKIESGTLLLDYSVTSTSKLYAKCKDVVAELAKAKNITLSYSGADLECRCDEGRISRVLVNFLDNAIKYSSAGNSIETQTSENEGWIRFSVKDQGRGIPAHLQETIFDRFQQVRNEDARVGTGLGLPICKALVEAHSGTVGVISIVGEGTTFWFTLPVRPIQRL